MVKYNIKILSVKQKKETNSEYIGPTLVVLIDSINTNNNNNKISSLSGGSITGMATIISDQ